MRYFLCPRIPFFALETNFGHFVVSFSHRLRESLWSDVWHSPGCWDDTYANTGIDQFLVLHRTVSTDSVWIPNIFISVACYPKTVDVPQWPRWNTHVDAAGSRCHNEWRGDFDDSKTFQGNSGIPNFKTQELSYWRRRASKPQQHRHRYLFKSGETVTYYRAYSMWPFSTSA